ncbi:structural maintenance of chromosomes protein 2 [Stomoxys calcitrans]|uniref:structural maintenance of chromosomes protein 2 n=1 Tax=Stomoxys calcitrans TaxID=35570 RepID=UPI0027E295F0|nr:structural maintenance of chromosomes protein 2 [Stomoxys calcitrans]
MYIKSVVIDGFKSYGRRTEIHGFDPEFTAITGLNGTGKSNILDSICFVLGIMNLGQVRAASLQDLVYKSGQAGITKATVTLIFDNSNPEQCPLGYEKCREISVTRQIVVGGKNKYLINGKLVQNKKVSDFFCSVQLNVNNPNFLIMQGRITKVLNMKPHEILSMIEEAAGTSMYETKREATTKLMEKKDAKVRETNTLLHEEVEPKLDKLRRERSAYMDFQKICRDIEYLTRIHVSYRWLKHNEALKSIEANIEKLNARIEAAKQNIIDNDAERERIAESTKELQQKIDTESGGELKKIEAELEVQLQHESKSSGNLKAGQGAVDQEEKKLKALLKSIADDEKSLRSKEAEMAKVKDLFQSLKEADERDALAYEAAKKKFEAVSQGLSTNEDGQASSLQDQLMHAKQSMSKAETTIKTSDMELRHCRTVLKQKETETQSNDAAYNKDKNLLDNLTVETQGINQKLQAIDYEDGVFESLQERKNALHREMRQLQQQLDRTNACRFDMRYRDPEPGFDRSKVRGMVGKLFDVLDEQNCLALMMTAGGSLYSHVTDDDVTSKKILQKGQLQQRVTIIPINKITSHPISQQVVEAAKRIGGKENVHSAMHLIRFDPYYEPVMKFVFGRTLICRDLNVAKQVTYHRDVRCRSVTLEGDVVDPEGTLSGGSKPKGGNILQELAEIKRLERELAERKQEMIQIDKQLANVENKARSYNKLKETLELRQHELNACKQRLAQTTFQQNQEEILSLKERIKSLEEDLIQARETQKTSKAKAKDIEAKLADAKGFRERELKAATEDMKKAKIQAEKSSNNWKKHEQGYETLQMEIEALQKDIATAKEQRSSIESNIESLKEGLEEMRAKSKDAAGAVAELRKRIKEQKDTINSQNKELKNMYVKRDKLEKHNQELTLEIKKRENEVNKVRSESKDSSKKLENLESKYPWIGEDKEFFGTKNTRYDYSKENPVEAGEKLSSMIEQKDKMERHINLKAMVLLEREEEQYQETMRRKKIVEQDKEKIKHIICKMDEKKREKVEKAWKVVDENFSGIFSSLLQGAQARLNPVKQNNQLMGLEIKVGFNGVWKESLGELSGGQRSLVALSLVLAMLKFSPAPLYILDEVDAALDMSHTQNIGNMLKAHFTASQFIIVSLKDGMFNNANVLFRTKFEEGVSAVTRTVNPKLGRK